MSKEKIAFDFDDVLFPFTYRFWQYCRDHHGLGVDNFDSITLPHFDQILGCDYDHGYAIYSQLINNSEKWEEFHSIEPLNLSEALTALNQLKQAGKQLEIVTAREPHLQKSTVDFVEKYFPNIFSQIHLCNTYGQVGKRFTKSEMCFKHGLEVLVDDNLAHINDVEKEGLIGIPFGTYPWSRRSDTIDSWSDLVERILSL